VPLLNPKFAIAFAARCARTSPAAPDVPSCRIEHVETPNPLNPLGVKGAGEGGTIPAPAAIIAAIEDALSPFGVHFAEMPLTPDRIVEALRRAGAYD
jgi:carbon-monoxide dehydrogenase large subunit